MTTTPPPVGFANIASLAKTAARTQPGRPEPRPDQDRAADAAAAAAGFVPRDPPSIPSIPRRTKAPSDPMRRIDFSAPQITAARLIAFCNARNLNYADAIKLLLDTFDRAGRD